MNQELNVAIDADASSSLSQEVQEEFSTQFEFATQVTETYIAEYERAYLANKSRQQVHPADVSSSVKPNRMQQDAISQLTRLLQAGEKRALVISATGTGKTFLAALHARAIGVRRLLFIVHRENIARKAMRSFKQVFGNTRTFGLYTGTEKTPDADFVFSTVQTLSKERHLKRFSETEFEYVVLDESHHAAAASYASCLEYFDPKFLLGMTATPERTDGSDIFKYFNHNIAYEIRLQRALDEGMLAPFHYYGISDISIDGQVVNEGTKFSDLASEQRIDHIIEKARKYGHWGEKTRGLIFCSRIDEASQISKAMNQRGFRTIALSGADSETSRENAIRLLESDESEKGLDYIITVDIFNEGIDIPAVNQVLMLRPTNSAIVFIQQLGRGLRRLEGLSKYLTVLDFIGNYQNNYLIPVALYGDTSFDKDKLRRLVFSGDTFMPGTSTVSFDRITRERIFESINQSKSNTLKELKVDYTYLERRIGRIPMMVDFQEHSLRDPRQFGKYVRGSYRDFLAKIGSIELDDMSVASRQYLAGLSRDILDGRSIEEPIIILAALQSPSCTVQDIQTEIHQLGIETSEERIISAVRALNLRFSMDKEDGKRVPVGLKLAGNWLNVSSGKITRLVDFERVIMDDSRGFLRDLGKFCKEAFLKDLDRGLMCKSFVRYRRYSRSDVFRLLGKAENPVPQNVGGYLHVEEKNAFPIFVTYKKDDDVSPGTRYEDHFKSPKCLHYFSKNRRTLSSPCMSHLREVAAGKTSFIPIFVKKNNDEGTDFYFLGDSKPRLDSFHEDVMKDGNKEVSVVRLDLDLNHEIPTELYQYLIS